MFSTENNGYSLSDIAAVSGNTRSSDSTWGDGGAWWIIILFLFVFCGWGNNGNWGNGQSALTRADLCQDMNFSDLESSARSLQSGLCDGFYAQNTSLLNGFAGVNSNLSNGFAGVNNAVCDLGYQTQSGVNAITTAAMQNTNTLQQDINSMNVANMQNTNALQTQISDCCCTTQSNLKDIAYQMATDTCSINTNASTNTRDIIDAENANARAILDAIQQNKVDAMQDKIATLTAQNQQLAFAASQQAQNAYLLNELRPNPIPAYVTASPFQSIYGMCNCSAT